MTDVDSSFMKKLLNITLAKRKAVVQPQGIPNHAQWVMLQGFLPKIA